MLPPSEAEVAALLRRAREAQSANRIDEALALARRATEVDPESADAWSYLGSTLVTRRLAFAEGLSALERALALAPDDPGVNYTLGWCYEFVAYRLEKHRPEPVEGQATRPYRDPLALYDLAAERLQHCIDLDPEPGLKEDAQDLLDSILNRR